MVVDELGAEGLTKRAVEVESLFAETTLAT